MGSLVIFFNELNKFIISRFCLADSFSFSISADDLSVGE